MIGARPSRELHADRQPQRKARVTPAILSDRSGRASTLAIFRSSYFRSRGSHIRSSPDSENRIKRIERKWKFASAANRPQRSDSQVAVFRRPTARRIAIVRRHMAVTLLVLGDRADPRMAALAGAPHWRARGLR